MTLRLSGIHGTWVANPYPDANSPNRVFPFEIVDLGKENMPFLPVYLIYTCEPDILRGVHRVAGEADSVVFVGKPWLAIGVASKDTSIV